MAYNPQTWADGEAGGTPITADRLNHIEQGVAGVELLEGPRGPKGDKGETGAAGADSTVAGPKGDKGEPGAAGATGADGFPTEADWNALVGRVTALEP